MQAARMFSLGTQCSIIRSTLRSTHSVRLLLASTSHQLFTPIPSLVILPDIFYRTHVDMSTLQVKIRKREQYDNTENEYAPVHFFQRRLWHRREETQCKD